MGNSNEKSYQINKSSIVTVYSKGKSKNMNETNGILQKFACTKIKKRFKNKSEIKQSLSCIISKEDCGTNINRHPEEHYDSFFDSIDNNTYVNDTSKETKERSPEIVVLTKVHDNYIKETASIEGSCQKDVLERHCHSIKADSQVIPVNNGTVEEALLDSYKTHQMKKKRYICSPRTVMDHFDISNYPKKASDTVVSKVSNNVFNGLRVLGNGFMSSKCKASSMIEPPLTISRPYGGLSETSLNSDDLMLSTDVNLDQADDDVSKDYNASEKEDPFISALNIEDPKCCGDDSLQMCVEDSEKNDVVYFDSSRESSVSLNRKLGYVGHHRRPHSFSTPLRSDSKSKVKRSSNLSTVDSIDLAWTWMSASESANLTQEISNLKLLLLKTKRLLLDDYNNDQFSTLNEDNVSVFSEPNTPLYYNDNMRMSNLESEGPPFKDWYNMDKEALIQELHDISQRNASLQCQLHDKNRVIDLLQDGRRRFQRPSARAEPFVSRIGRSSTFDSSTMMNPLSPTQECSSNPLSLSKNGKTIESDSRNIDSGLYQSSSSTDSCVYQN